MRPGTSYYHLTMVDFDTADIRRYYDRNTAAFVAYGQGGSVGAIHRPVWGEQVDNPDAAFHYVEDRIVDHLLTLGDESTQLRVIDLGCGVGSSLCYLATRLPIQGTGLTLSPVQVRHAENRIRKAGLVDRVVCREGDFCAPPDGLSPADLTYAIESFVHGPDPAQFFAACARLTRSKGLLVVCDDFQRQTESARAARTLEQFRHGWHLNTLIRLSELHAFATTAGFDAVSVDDLTPHLKLHRRRDRTLAAFIALFGWFPLDRTRFSHLVGGNALRSCLLNGWIGYDLAVFRRR